MPAGAAGPAWARKARKFRFRDEFVAEVRRGQPREPSERRRATFAEVADEWLAAQRSLVDVGELAASTWGGYEISVRRHLKPYLGSRAMRSLTPDDLVAWHADQRRTGAAARSIKGRWNALRGVLSYAARHRLIPASTADALTSRERPKPGSSRTRILTESEMRVLIDASSGRYRMLVSVKLFGGLRISEALGLTWRDMDFATGHLRVRRQLARNGKRVPLKTAQARRDVDRSGDEFTARFDRNWTRVRVDGDRGTVTAQGTPALPSPTSGSATC